MRAKRSSRTTKKGPDQYSSAGSSNVPTDETVTADDSASTSLPASETKSPRPAITRDIRLREELAHPFRRPKLVIFGTLAVSAVVGSLFAFGRLALGADAPDVFLVNTAVNVPAAALFAWLAKREVDFGRRSLGVLANCPQARDLPLEQSGPSGGGFVGGTSGTSGTSGSGGGVLGRLVSQQHVVVVAGRARDVVDVLLRAESALAQVGAGQPRALVAVVACALDAGGLDVSRLGPGDGRTVVAARVRGGDRDAEDTRAWTAWTGRVARPRKHVAVFCIAKGSPGRGLGDDYVHTVDDAARVDLGAILVSVMGGALVGKQVV